VKSGSLSLSRYTLSDNASYNFWGLCQERKKGPAIGFYAINLQSGDVELRQKINDIPETIRTNQSAYTLSLAEYFGKLVSVELRIKHQICIF